MNIFRAVFPSCRQVSQMQSEALDRSLPFSKRAAMRLHLLVCSWCRRYGKQIRFLKSAAQEHGEDFESAGAHGLSEEARERMKQAMRK